MNLKKLQELLQDESFTNKLFNLEDAKDAQKLFRENGIELSIEELEQTKDLMDRFQNGELTPQEKSKIETYTQENGELNDQDLENVTGGELIFAICTLLTVAAGLTATVLVCKDVRW